MLKPLLSCTISESLRMHMFNHNTYFPDCGFPSTIFYGNVTIPNGTEYNATAMYTCGENRGLVGKEAIFCLSTGFWDTPPVCSLGYTMMCDMLKQLFTLQLYLGQSFESAISE